MNMNYTKALIIVLLALLLYPSQAHACSLVYDPNTPRLDMYDYLEDSQAVVAGQVIGFAEDSRLSERDYGGKELIHGYARVRVHQWLIGDGPDIIEIGSFDESMGASCAKGIWMNNRSYFLLSGNNGGDSIRYPLTNQSEGAETVLTFNEQNTERIIKAIQTVKGVEVTPIEPWPETATNQTPLLIFIGVGALIGGGWYWRKKIRA